METFEVGVERDHIERLAKAKPLNAISELIWNAYDVDATEVCVEFEEGTLVKLGLVRVADNGSGIPFEEALGFFKNLGGSWKQKRRRTDGGRAIHGLKGQGRMKAFALGTSVVWRSYCNGKSFSVSGNVEDLKTFTIDDPVTTTRRGCVVEITDIVKDFEIRAEHGFTDAVRDVFALQLYEDSAFSIIYDGEKIDAAESIRSVTPIEITTTIDDGTEFKATLEIVEWRKQVQRKLMLCLPGRFSFQETAPGTAAERRLDR